MEIWRCYDVLPLASRLASILFGFDGLRITSSQDPAHSKVLQYLGMPAQHRILEIAFRKNKKGCLPRMET